MKQNVKKQNNFKKILFIVLIILILLASIIVITKTNNTKINNVKQGVNELKNNVGEVPLDITNQITETPNKPILSAGMIPIKWNGTNWVITTEDDTEWHNYSNGKMANIMLNDGVYQSEIASDMKNKELASENINKPIQPEEMGTIFTWIPRFAYNENNEALYLNSVSSIAGEYTTSEIFTYKASGVDKQDIALTGIWVEKESKLGAGTTASLATENNTYGLIGNIKTEHKVLDANFINSINKDNETGIKSTTSAKAIIKVVNEKQTEPIMAKLSAKGKKVTIEIIKGDVTRVISITENGKEAIKEDRKFTHKVETGGLNKFVLIDNLGNQRQYEINVISPEIYVSSNQDNYIEFNGEKWYPYNTQVTIKFSDDMSEKTGYYQEINGTTNLLKNTGNPSPWVNRNSNQTAVFNLTETMTYKAKIENSLGEVLGEDEETIHIMPTDTSIPTNYWQYNVGGIYPVKVSWNNSGGSYRYGTETYKYDTYIRDAARHMGLIKQGDTEKELYIKIVPIPQGGYIGSTRNGLGTSNQTTYYNGYMFVTKNGEEIKLPKINNVNVTEEDNKITVKVDAQTSNPGAEIVKYYYIMDNTDAITNMGTDIISKYTESDSNEFVFENVQAFKNHKIRVFVKDNYGEIGVLSEIYEETAKTANGLQKPTIEIVNETTLKEQQKVIEEDEYYHETWYPYRTQIKVTYFAGTNSEMSTLGLNGYYKTINKRTKEDNGWSNLGNNSTYTFSLYESTIYKFKLVDSLGNESEETTIDLNIMPYDILSASGQNYRETLNETYPVRVTGGTSGDVYGTDIYSADSTYISHAALHMGLVKQNETKDLYIKIVKSPEYGFTASTKHEITSKADTTGANGFIFVKPDGTEIKSPTLSATVNNGEEELTVTVNAEHGTPYTSETSTITKYYYSIDDGAYNEQSAETENANVYKFNVTPYNIHTIKVYVEDSNGFVSDVITLTGTATKELPTPTIKILKPGSSEEFADNDEEIVEYDGKTWYPSATRIQVTYLAEEGKSASELNTKMSNLNLKGFYEYTYDTTGQVTSSNTGTNASYTHSLGESATYKFKLQDSLGNVSEEVSIHLNIMPNEYYSNYGLPTNYVNNVGAIYPVRVTGDSSIRTTEWNSRCSGNRYIYI